MEEDASLAMERDIKQVVKKHWSICREILAKSIMGYSDERDLGEHPASFILQTQKLRPPEGKGLAYSQS